MNVEHERIRRVNNHLEIACAPEIREKYRNIGEALKETLIKLPDNILDLLFDNNKPLFILVSQELGNQTSFLQEDGTFTYKTGINIIILSSELDTKSHAAIIGVIAHELAHAYLHFYKEKSSEERDREAIKQAARWGFKKALIVSRDELNLNDYGLNFEELEE